MRQTFEGMIIRLDDPSLIWEEEPQVVEGWGEEYTGIPDGDYVASIISVTLGTCSDDGRKGYWCVSVLFDVPMDHLGFVGTTLLFEKTYALKTASAVREARFFFAMFDYPLVNENDLPAACERAKQGVCQIRIRNSREGGDVLGIMKWRPVKPDEEDGEEIWDHARHWRGPCPTPNGSMAV